MGTQKRTMQIDVKGPNEKVPGFMDYNLIVDGRTCRFYMSRSNYEAFIYDGVFIRDGKTKDSANILNTTKVFEEED